jgi:hypothetical protein
VAGTSASENPKLGGNGGIDWDSPLNGHSGGDDIVVIKLNAAGAYQWHTFHGDEFDDGANGTAAYNGSVYVTGYTFDAVQSDISVMKLNSAGTYQWHRLFGSSTDDDFGLDVALSGNGSAVYIIGRSLAAWNNGSVSPTHSYTGDADLVVLKVNNSGACEWHTFYGSSGEDLGQDIALDTRGYIHAVGTSRATWNGDGDVPPRHRYTDNQDIYELSLTDISSRPLQGVGGEVRAVNRTAVFDGLITANRWSILGVGLPALLAIGIGILTVRRRIKP